jgi:hypothetical protein
MSDVEVNPRWFTIACPHCDAKVGSPCARNSAVHLGRIDAALAEDPKPEREPFRLVVEAVSRLSGVVGELLNELVMQEGVSVDIGEEKDLMKQLGDVEHGMNLLLDELSGRIGPQVKTPDAAGRYRGQDRRQG